nr:putative ribonuclease H-like domain-containing protein [Tanacetum cinerariifolium]
MENLPKVDEIHALSNPVTLNSIPTPQESKVVKNNKEIAPGIFRINPFKISREEKHVPNNVRASARTKPITVSQYHVITKKDVNSDSNGLSSIGIDNTKTRRPQPRSNTKNDRVPSTSKSSQSKNKGAKVEEHHQNLLLSKNMKHMSSTCNNITLNSQNVISKVVCAMCKQCLMSVNHDVCLRNYVNGKNSRGQFCDSDLEVAFRRNTFFVRNLEGVDLLKGNRSTNLYTIILHEMASASPICLMARASSTKSWLWHQRLSYVNFDTINNLSKNDLVSGLPKFKYNKEHLCPSCEQGKSKRVSHPPKHVLNSRQRLHLLHMDLCGPMRISSINGKQIIVPLQSPVIIIRTDNGTDSKNQVLKEYFDSFGISHQMSSVRTPQQNGAVKRQNQTLVEAARTMLIFSRTPLFLWAEAIATTKPDISFLHVFGALCYPKNDHEDIEKLGAKGLNLTYAPSTITTQQPTEGELDLLFEAMYDDYIGVQLSDTA